MRGADAGGDRACRDLFLDRAAFDAWVQHYRARLRAEGRPDSERGRAMDSVNPKFVLRNHLAELAIRRARGGDESARLGLAAAVQDGAEPPDFSEVRTLLEVLSRPFDEPPQREGYAAPPPDWAAGLQVSCSS